MNKPILSLNKIKNNLIKWIIRSISSQKYLAVQLDITNSCNLKCSHCYRASGDCNESLSYEDWNRILNQYQNLIDKLGLNPIIYFCGGEPMLSPNLQPLILNCKRRWPKVRIGIISNGTILNDSWIECFCRNNISIQISLDGPDNIKHDSIRGPGAFEKVYSNLEVLVKNNINVSFQAVLSKKSAEWMEDFFLLASSLKIDHIAFNRLIKQGNAISNIASGKDDVLSPLELKKAYENIVRLSQKYNIQANTDAPLFCLINPSMGTHHMLGYQGLVIDYQGNLKVTSRTNVILGNIIKDGLENIFFKNPILMALRNGEIEKCNKCKFLKICGGDRNAAYAETGSFFSHDPGCWLNINKDN
ncbi:MAG: radical SAM protein [Oligoflexia bacterium]|nr:radical SAM protein [Oligoflexia bacterium]